MKIDRAILFISITLTMAGGSGLAQTGALEYQSLLRESLVSRPDVFFQPPSITYQRKQNRLTNNDWQVLDGFAPPTFDAPNVVSQVSAIWIGGNGEWNVPANWSGGVVPNNGTPAGTTYAVVIDNAGGANSIVSINLPAVVDSLTIDAGDRLDINTGASLTVVNSGPGTGSLVNNGTIFLQTDLIINGNVALTGSGTVQMLSTGLNGRIFGLTATDVLTNQGNTIVGSGKIGNNSMTLDNLGTIRASGGLPLTIDPGSGGVTNSGTIEAAGTSIFLDDGTFNNTGGTISASGATIQVSATAGVTGGTVTVGPGSTLQLNGGSVTGGVLNNSGNILVPATMTGTIGGAVTNAPFGGQITIGNSVLVLTGGPGNTYTNAGTITLNSGAVTDLIINGDVTLTGTGTVQMFSAGGSSSRIFGLTATDVLTNQGNTIVGSGKIGNNSMTLDNLGTIRASGGLPLTIDPGSGGVTNSGTIEAAGTSIFLDDGTFNNTGGTISASGATIQVSATAGVTGGTVTVGPGSTLQLNGGSVTGGVLNNSGNILVPATMTGTIGGAVNNAAFGGQINLINASLTVPATSVISNAGNVLINTTSAFTMGAGVNFTQTAGRTNIDGTLTANGGQVNITGGLLTGSGLINSNLVNSGRVEPGFVAPGILQVNGNYTQTAAGTLGIELNGTNAGTGYDVLSISGATILAGTLSLTGTFSPAVGDAFTILPTSGVGAVAGNFIGLAQGSSITLNGQQFQISYSGGTGNDVVLATLTAPPTSLTYSSNPATYTRNLAITDNIPTSGGGPVVSYAVSPALPTGLSFSTTTGVISGTPAVLSATANYIVTATNGDGSTQATVNITVNDAAPASLTYSTNPAIYIKNTAITANTPTNGGGAVVSYAISPTLPSGMLFSTTTGVISGTPAVLSAAANYTVTAANTGGATQAVISITVNDAAPDSLTYSSNPAIYIKDTAITPNTPNSGGGAVVSYAISPALPSGMLFSTTTGVISGTPSALSAAANYTVTAANTGGATQTTVNITVINAPSLNITVVNNNSSGAGSLRQAILDANNSGNASDTIDFAANVRGKIVLTGFEIEINKPIGTNLTIIGPGANLLSIETNSAFRVFRVQLGNIKISGLRISRGFAPDGFVNRGGGIWVVEGANLTLENCRITENLRGGIYTQSGSALTINNSLIAGNDGGGIISEGILTMTNSTVADNTGDDGAGISESGGSMTLTNVTVSGNRGIQVGGISVNGGFTTILNSTICNNGNVSPSGNVGGLKSAVGATVNLKNTIIARNLSSTIAEDVSGTIFSQGTNLIGDTTGSMGFTAADLQNVNPRLGGFANNGGATYTHSLRSTSPAINAGNNTGAPATDQRGVPRAQGAAVDIGAYETGVRPAPFGRIVFVSDRNGDREIYSMNPDATGQTRLTTNSATDEFPDWSPDGTQIAFSTDRNGNFEIYTMNADGSNLIRLTTNSVPDSEPAWSPDGSKIAFVRNGAGIFLMDPNGTNQTAIPNTADGASPSWSPDGTQIVFTCVNMGSAICKIDADGTNRTPFVFTDALHYSPAWSPDGNSIAFSIDLDVSPFLYFYSPHNPNVLRPMLNATSGDEVVGFDPAFSPDGAKLAATNGDLYLRDADGGNPVLLINRLVNGNSYHPGWFGHNTPTGANVTALSGTASITFSSVGPSGGTTIVLPIDPATAGSLPGGYSLGAGFPAYEITTTANYTAPIVVCLQVSNTVSMPTFDSLRILHNESGTLVDRTILSPDSPGPDYSSKTICARVNSLSPFVVAESLAPTAASVNVGGRVSDDVGRGVYKARISITNASSETRQTITNAFGFYRFDEVAVGETYIISARHKRFQFVNQTQIVFVGDEITNVDFIALPE